MQASEKFFSLYRTLRSSGRLFEDAEFIPGPAILPINSPRYIWRRPSEIAINSPEFITGDALKTDLFQGNLQDCWFIAATACMVTTHANLLAQCIPSDQSFNKDYYSGIFRFNFWYFGKWVEVIIDDYLPTNKNGLVFGHNKTYIDEFWVPLFEKAYAKLHGGYQNLQGGFTNNALVDFTGGISEFIDLKQIRKKPEHLYDKMFLSMQKYSMLGSHIEGNRISETALPNGLYNGHAYSITNVVRIKSKGTQICLLRLRNPWGKGEWNGAWSDSSIEWQNTPSNIKQDVGMVNMEDGEFWMSFDDWINNFEFLTICHINPDARHDGKSHAQKQNWEVETHHSEWLRGFSAGGCGNPPDQKLFWSNPQFSVQLHDKDGKGICHVIISLLQKSINQKTDVPISFSFYKVKPGVPLLLNVSNYDEHAVILSKSAPTFVNLREVSSHLEVEPGNYVIIPATFKPNTEAKFLLRIFTETATKSQMIDIPTTIKKPAKKEDPMDEIFTIATNGEKEMDAKELVQAVNQLLLKDGSSKTIGLSTARGLVGLLDKDRSGLLSFAEFRVLITDFILWKTKFTKYDADESGFIDTFELKNVFDSVGFSVSRSVIESIVRRYGGKKCHLSFEDFIQCCCRIVTLYNHFVSLSKGGIGGKIDLTLEEWIANCFYC